MLNWIVLIHEAATMSEMLWRYSNQEEMHSPAFRRETRPLQMRTPRRRLTILQVDSQELCTICQNLMEP